MIVDAVRTMGYIATSEDVLNDKRRRLGDI